MKLFIKNTRDTDFPCDALILPFTEKTVKIYDEPKSSLSQLIKKTFPKEFSGKQNELFLIPAPPGIRPERLLFVGLGKKEDISHEKVRQAGGKALVHLRERGMKNIALSTRLLLLLNMPAAAFIEGGLLGLYTFKRYLQEKDDRGIRTITLLSRTSQSLKDDLRWIKTVVSAVNFAKDMINTPANDMTPSHLAERARSLKSKTFSVKILEKKDARRLGMGSYLSVASGSHQPPKFIVLHHGGAKGAPVVLIGKSITFDSGGLSLKPADGMEKMKYDMAGGAAVLGIMKAASEFRLPVNLIGILPATENVIGGSAARPGDIVRALDGKTIEIISTDAEGRMTLADAIVYAKRFRPKMIIDIATLTGACAIALGNVTVAMTGNSRDLTDALKQAGDDTYERVWEMPLFEEYKEYIKSDIADLKNTGGKSGALMSSAYFLYTFAGDTPWAHLDIAGTAWVEKEKPYMPKGASGIGVRLVLYLIKNLR
jgi:leucyl aminopeptidase